MPSVPVLNSHTLGSVYLSKTAGGISSTLGQERGVVVQRVQVLTGETENTKAAPHGVGAFLLSSHGDGGLEALLATCDTADRTLLELTIACVSWTISTSGK